MTSLFARCANLCCFEGTGKFFFKNSIPLRTVTQVSTCSGEGESLGLVLGVYNDPKDIHNRTFELTKTADTYNRITNGKLIELLHISGPPLRAREVRCFYGLEPKFPCVAVVGLGDSCLGYNDEEQLDEHKEHIREAAAIGCQVLQKSSKCENVYIESFGHAESAAEGAALGVWVHQEHRSMDRQVVIPKLHLFDDCDLTGWQIGLHKAAAQNLARQLCEMPPNHLTPRTFAEHAVKLLHVSGINLEMKIKHWLKMVGMDAFLTLARGSCEEPILLEATYYGCDPNICPIVLIGKGVTFDTGGLCIKDYGRMDEMRGDMSGAACVIATLRAASALQLPVNIRALLPMCENMLGPRAMKPGDIVKSLNDKTIRVEDTDIDGRLAMVDILSYAATYHPKFILDVGALSKGMLSALGTSATGVFTNNDKLWEQMRIAGIHTGDRVWRFPLWNHFTKQTLASGTADLKTTNEMLGSACMCASFLEQFLCGKVDWIHLDTYGVTLTEGTMKAYLQKGMTGRPTRTLIEFLAQFACQQPDTKKKGNAKRSNDQCKLLSDQPCK